MNNEQASKAQFSSSFAGSALIFKERVDFTFSGTISGGSRTDYRYVSVPSGLKYFSDATWFISGGEDTDSEPWKRAPRSHYFMLEPSFPTPRVYLNKSNRQDSIEISAFITNAAGTFTLSRSYTVNVDVYVFSSNVAY